MASLTNYGPIEDWSVSGWLGDTPAQSLTELRGHVVAIEAFQMLCPGCVAHGLPQAARLQRSYGREVVVLGLHTVFEHHDVMTPAALRVFMHEYQIPFPVGIDEPQGQGLPVTMSRWSLQGTPTLLLIDRAGNLRFHGFGRVDDLSLGVAVGALLAA